MARHERCEAAASFWNLNAQHVRLGKRRPCSGLVVAAPRGSIAGSESPYLRLGYELCEAVFVSWGDCQNAVMNERANDDALDIQYRRRLMEVQKRFVRMGSLAYSRVVCR